MNAQNPAACFNKIDDEFGGFLNKADGYPVLLNGIRIPSVEHLYHALKFPDHPELQEKILTAPTATIAKAIAIEKDEKKKKEIHTEKVRKDWKAIESEVMEYCLRAKLIYHWMRFGNLLKSTGDREIVSGLPGTRAKNVVGKLLMKLRDEFVNHDNAPLRILDAPTHLNLTLMGEEIDGVDRRDHLCQVGTRMSAYVAELRA